MKNYNPLSNYHINNNSLSFADIEVSKIETQLGEETPLYIYSKDVIKHKINKLRDLITPKIKIYYSIKANPFKDIINYLHKFVDGYDVSSIHEMNLALDTGIRGKEICYTGPGKSILELQSAIESDVVISAESKIEIERIVKLGSDLHASPKILIRVNPNFTQRHAGMKMASGSSPFGIDEEYVPDIIQQLENTNVLLKGFHIYTGSQILDANAVNDAQNHTFKLVDKLANFCSVKITTINIGGGFGLPYFEKHSPLDINSVAENLNKLILGINYEKFSKKLNTILELGRFIVGECGIYVCRITDKKVSRGKTYVITDGGMHHHLAASGNLGQKERKNFPVYVANRIKSEKTEKVTVIGKLCTPLDIIADDIKLSECDVGDYIAIMNSGAYSLSASPINFLSHPVAPEILV